MRKNHHHGQKWLEQEIEHENYIGLLEELKHREVFLRRFNSWRDVLSFMRQGTSRDPEKDRVLRPIFQAHRKDKDARWRTILLAFFWPALESIHWQRSGWDPDAEERWQNIVWTFLQVACRVDVRRRPNRLVQKLFNDTVHRLHAEYRRLWARADREVAMEPADLEELAQAPEETGLAVIELQDAQSARIAQLQAYLKENLINDADFLLLVGTRVYGKSMAACAREAGLNYHAAYKRRQRAEEAIRKSGKNLDPAMGTSMSKSTPPTPPLSGRGQ